VQFVLSTLPSDHIVTTQNAGGDDANDSDADLISGVSAPTGPIPSGGEDLTLDMGIYRPGIELNKTVNLTQIDPSQVVRYTLTVTNTGNVLLNPVALTDTLPPGFGYVAGSANPLPDPAITDQVLVWSDITGGLGLPPGDTAQITFEATVPEAIGTYINQAVAAGSHPRGQVEDEDEAPIVVGDPAVQIDKGVVPPGAVNGIITFTITITNIGPSTLVQVPLIDRFSGPIEYIGGTPVASSIDNANQVLGWNDLTLAGPNGFGRDLDPGQTFDLTTVFRIVGEITEMSVTNAVTVTDAVDLLNNPANDDDDAVVLINEPTAIELLSFTADRQGDLVVLNWHTAVEIDNYGFRLLRSATGALADAQEIGFVAGQGYGTTSGSSYTFVDKRAATDQTYTYWLVDVDLNGVETTHEPVTVEQAQIDSGEPTILYLPLIFK
jgi:uncharacterized repeat protein (TIGR01451 family)